MYNLAPMGKRYVYRQYKELFAKRFYEEKIRIESLIKDSIFIEHVGSTSIPGMGGKGIIDILVAVSNKREIPKMSSQLIDAGYYFGPDDGTIERWFHGRKVSDSKRYHLHLTFEGSKDWKEMIAFRDYLKTHPEDFKRYMEVKKRAVKEASQDKDIYMRIKEPLIKEIIQKAIT